MIPCISFHLEDFNHFTIQMQNHLSRNATSPSPSYSNSSMSSHRASPPVTLSSQSILSNESDSPPTVSSPPNSPTSPLLRVSRRMLPETPKTASNRDVKSEKNCRQRSKFFAELSSRDSLDSGFFSRSTTCDSSGKKKLIQVTRDQLKRSERSSEESL